jgi:hemoglobin
MRHIRSAGLLLLLVLMGGCAAPPASAPPPSASLYDRLGGYNAIAAVTDDFLARLGGDPQFGRFFGKAIPDQLHVLRQHLVEQLCQAAGGPCFYTGRPMRAVHVGMHITEAEWNAAAGHLVASLDKFHVPPAEKTQVIAFVVSQKPDIVGQ